MGVHLNSLPLQISCTNFLPRSIPGHLFRAVSRYSRNPRLVPATRTHGPRHLLFLVLFFIRTSWFITKIRSTAWPIASNQAYSQLSAHLVTVGLYLVGVYFLGGHPHQ